MADLLLCGYRFVRMSIQVILVSILGLSLLAIVHEGGHYLAARAFGMRVTRFSIGFGPTLVSYKPKEQPDHVSDLRDPVLGVRDDRGHEPGRRDRP